MLRSKLMMLGFVALSATVAAACGSDSSSSGGSGGSAGMGGFAGSAGSGGDAGSGGGEGGTGGAPEGALGPGSGSTTWNAQPKEATGCTFDAENTVCTDCSVSGTSAAGGGLCNAFTNPQIVRGCEVPGGVLGAQLSLDVFVTLDASSTGDGNLSHDVTVVAENPSLAAAAGLVTVDGAEIITTIEDGDPAEVVNSLDPDVAGELLGFFTGGATTLTLDDEILPATTAVTTTASPTADVNFSGNFLISLTIQVSGTPLDVDSSSCTFDNPPPNDGTAITFDVL